MLVESANGDQEALNRVFPLVYDELRRLAHAYMQRERPGQTLETTALVHEAYVRLVESGNVQWQTRAHFLAIAAQVMRRILIDHARTRQCEKRGAGLPKVSLNEAAVLSDDRAGHLIAVDEALLALEAIDRRASRVFEARFFGGMTIEETAEVMRLSAATVRRDWSVAKAFLYRAISTGAQDAA